MPVTIAIEAILPPDPVDILIKKVDKLERDLEGVLKGPIKNQLKDAFEKRVTGWSSKPEFVGLFSHYQGSAGSMYVFPRGENAKKWKWVSGGTPSRIITAKRAPRLRFRTSYVPHTRPGNKYGGSGQYLGPYVTPKSVQHPGIAARDFEQNIADELESDIIRLLSLTITRALL